MRLSSVRSRARVSREPWLAGHDVDVDLANAPTRLRTLLDTILATDERLLLVVAQIVPTTDDAENARVRGGPLRARRMPGRRFL